MENYQQNQEMDYTQNIDFNNNYRPEPQKKSSTGLIVAISVLSSILVVLIIVGTLFLTGVLRIEGGRPFFAGFSASDVDDGEEQNTPIPVNKTMYVNCDVSVTLRTAPSVDAAEIRQIPNGTSVFVIEYTDSTFAKVSHKGQDGYIMSEYLADTKQTIPVEKTMYVDCNVSLTLRNGPGTSYSSVLSIPVGEEVYVFEYTNGEFAKVSYRDTIGYVMSDYLSDAKPYVWDFNASAVENFVENSLYAFVTGVNANNSDYVYDYFSGDIVEKEIKSCNSIAANVISEDILQVDCHSVTRISPVQVTVIRDSVIRVVYNDGTTKDIKEKYQYTVDYSKDRMYIVALKAI